MRISYIFNMSAEYYWFLTGVLALALRRIDANSIGFKNRFVNSNLNFRSNLRCVLLGG